MIFQRRPQPSCWTQFNPRSSKIVQVSTILRWEFIKEKSKILKLFLVDILVAFFFSWSCFLSFFLEHYRFFLFFLVAFFVESVFSFFFTFLFSFTKSHLRLICPCVQFVNRLQNMQNYRWGGFTEQDIFTYIFENPWTAPFSFGKIYLSPVLLAQNWLDFWLEEKLQKVSRDAWPLSRCDRI